MLDAFALCVNQVEAKLTWFDKLHVQLTVCFLLFLVVMALGV